MQFKAVKFDKQEHGKYLEAWMTERGFILLPNYDYLPPTGYIVFNFAQAICIGFMIKCDNGTVINGDFMSDPNVPRDLRNEAVEYLRKTLYADAEEAGYLAVTVTTSIPAHVYRLQSLGYTVVEKDLTQLVKGL